MISGSGVVLECLIEQGVDTIFGYPGGAVIPLYDTLYDYKEYFNHILTAHEQGAIHGADGYARSTGKVGVCFTTSGPGATNVVTGIATAYMDSVPLVVISGQVPMALLGKDSFQEVDITGITLPITKHNYQVNDEDNLADIINEAFNIAQEGRPGPVLIDIPKDLFVKKYNYNRSGLVAVGADENTNSNEVESFEDIIAMIDKSSRPVIYAGGGVIISDSSEELYEFVNKTEIPVVNTLMGLGGFPRNHRLSLGMVGMHGSPEANLAVTNSDLIIAVGARFSDRVIGNVKKFATKAKVIHIDIDRTEIGKNKKTDCFLLGDVKEILKSLKDGVIKTNREEWFEEIERWKVQDSSQENAFNPRNILESINDSFNEDVIVATDVGQHQMWTAQCWKFKNPRTFLSSGGLGTMGYGLGAAIGAKVGNPNTTVVHITGDGSFRMNCNELATISRYDVPLLTVLFNNSCLGMVRQWQNMFQNKKYSETTLGNEVDYIKLVDAYGIKGHKVNSIEELKDAIEDFKKHNRATFIECIIDKDECVYPIVPPGKSIENLILK